MLVYKTSDDVYQIDNKIMPVGSCALEILGDKITIRTLATRIPIVNEVDPTTIDRNTNGDKYASTAALITAMKGFFA
jgi:hypothetical protein